MINSLIDQAKKLHFIGIGGSGMFPIVQIMHSRGYAISGSDNNEGDTINLERNMGIDVHIGHAPENLGDADLVIYSAAIMADNPELAAARDRGIPALERSEVLGYLTSQYDNCIAISGTHGKTTTTAMLTQMLLGAGLDPTAVIGGKLPLIGGNGRAGQSDLMVVEACEYVDTFLHLFPDIAVILNVDEDHLEYFKNLDNIIASFRKFAAMATKSIVVNGDDANSLRAVDGLNKPIITFGLGEANDYRAVDIQKTGPASYDFSLVQRGKNLGILTLNVPGEHNILNALAACAAALEAGAEFGAIAEHLPQFRGAGRRFEMLGTVNGIQIADDYAHHPAELTVTLNAAKAMGYNRVWAVFQPFTYSRTSLLLDDFAEALSIADRVVMSKIMGAREKNTYNIFTSDLAAKIPGSVWFEEFPEIAEYVMANAQPGDLVITLGCGDVYKCARLMLKD
ncbi:MAG: UDP-N-acetylmuramate--L-alanine ligase [Oscillospiraceae bacterium]